MKCEDVSVCGCRSRRQQSYKAIAHWSFDFSSECTYSMVFEEAEHSGELNIWFRVCGDVNCKGYGYCFEVQAEDVRHTNQWTSRCIL